MVATHTSDRNERKVTDNDTTKGTPPHKLLTNRIVPEIIPSVIPPVNQMTADEVVETGRTLHAMRTVISKEITTGAARSAARIFKDPPVVNWKDTGGMNPRDRNTVGVPPRATTPVRIGTGPLISPTRMGSQDNGSPRRYVVTQKVRNAEPLDASINGISYKHSDPAPTWSKVIGSKFSNKSRADVYSCCRKNLTSDTVLSESPNFMDLGLSSVNRTDELGSVFDPTTIIRSLTHGFNCLPHSHRISEATADRASGNNLKHSYNFKSDFETRREKLVDQDFECKKDSMSQPPLESTPIGTNTTNGKTSPSDSIPVRKKSPKPMLLTLPMNSPALPMHLEEKNRKGNIPGDLDPDP